MNFTTPIPLQKSNHPINYESKIVMLGSCFAENMGEKFVYFKFQTAINPFGIIFNTISIEKLIHRAVHKIEFTESDIFFHNELWHCFEVHSDCSDFSKDELLQKLNKILHQFRIQLEEATHINITYGTSWVYRNIMSNEIVANCHKVTQNQFQKELLSVETTQKSIKNTIALIQSINPNCHFIFTISPVRHSKDGFVENQVSKSHLITAIYSTIKHQISTINYFPSYEIMMDELRDYRFYDQDMLHPNASAIDFIWIKFFENYVAENEFGLMNQICEIQRSLKHRPFNPNSESHQLFLLKLQKRINTILETHPFMKF